MTCRFRLQHASGAWANYIVEDGLIRGADDLGRDLAPLVGLGAAYDLEDVLYLPDRDAALAYAAVARFGGVIVDIPEHPPRSDPQTTD